MIKKLLLVMLAIGAIVYNISYVFFPREYPICTRKDFTTKEQRNTKEPGN